MSEYFLHLQYATKGAYLDDAKLNHTALSR